MAKRTGQKRCHGTSETRWRVLGPRCPGGRLGTVQGRGRGAPLRGQSCRVAKPGLKAQGLALKLHSTPRSWGLPAALPPITQAPYPSSAPGRGAYAASGPGDGPDNPGLRPSEHGAAHSDVASHPAGSSPAALGRRCCGYSATCREASAATRRAAGRAELGDRKRRPCARGSVSRSAMRDDGQ